MYEIAALQINGKKSTETVYEIEDYPFKGILKCKKVTKHNIKYYNVAAAFDIETTNYQPLKVAWMYQWQFCIDKYVIFGRTWEEFRDFILRLIKELGLCENLILVVYVHNLSFEAQFLRGILTQMLSMKLKPFLTGKRKFLKLSVPGIEFRCSYKLSNMSLSKFCENSDGVTYYKLSDTYDYSKIRTCDTELTEEEKAYCYNDVRGLCQCISYRLKSDDIARIPMTSTGYVRRDMRNAINSDRRVARSYYEQFRHTKLSEDMYSICRRAFRGGDTHANYLWANQVVENVKSMDMTSAYPYVMMVEKYPHSKWYPTTMKLIQSIDQDKTPTVWIGLLKLLQPHVKLFANPYISLSKTVNISEPVLDNGRIRSAKELAIWITNVDWEIIQWTYDYTDAYFANLHLARARELPDPIKQGVMDYYRPKTELKGIEGKEYEYMKSKNNLNSCYGMEVTDIAKDEYVLTEIGDYVKDESSDLQQRLEKYYSSRNSFTRYEQGIYVPAYCRRNLNNMLRKLGNNKIYWDTDSNKFIDPEGELEELYYEENKKIIEAAESHGAYAYDKHGNKQYMGVWDYEGMYNKFKTLGAKKYLVEIPNKKGEMEYHSTISGVKKSVGKKFFTENGFDAFAIGTVIEKSGNLDSTFNDDMSLYKMTITDYQGHTSTFTNSSNVCMLDADYTIGITKDYAYLLDI